MKKILFLIFITFHLATNCQTKWLVKELIKTEKIDQRIYNQIEYLSKEITIIDCKGYPHLDIESSLYIEYDYLNNITKEYCDYMGDTCYISMDISKKLMTFDIVNEYKIIANYKCQKAILHKNNSNNLRFLIIWFTCDSSLKEFFINKKFNIEGVVLETENDVCIQTTTGISIVTTEPDILKIMRTINPCNLKSP